MKEGKWKMERNRRNEGKVKEEMKMKNRKKGRR